MSRLAFVLALILTSGCGVDPNDNSFEAYRAAKEAVRAQLKDPESAQFEGLEGRGVNGELPMTSVVGRVNAKNGFGGYSGWKNFRYDVVEKTVILSE